YRAKPDGLYRQPATQQRIPRHCHCYEVAPQARATSEMGRDVCRWNTMRGWHDLSGVRVCVDTNQSIREPRSFAERGDDSQDDAGVGSEPAAPGVGWEIVLRHH